MGVLDSLVPWTARWGWWVVAAWGGSSQSIMTVTGPTLVGHKPCLIPIVHTGGLLPGLPVVVPPPYLIVHHLSPGPGAQKSESWYLIYDCFPKIKTFPSAIVGSHCLYTNLRRGVYK